MSLDKLNNKCAFRSIFALFLRKTNNSHSMVLIPFINRTDCEAKNKYWIALELEC